MPNIKAAAPLIFEGTVKSLAVSNVSAVPADNKTALVLVNRFRHAPQALVSFTGKEITLRMAPGERLKQGDKLVFYTDSLVFGDNLAVQSMGHDPATPGLARAAAWPEPGDRRLQSRINAAHAVVSGRVVEVHPHKPAKALVKAAGAPSPPTGRISEHEPFWQEAVIEVSEAHKGPKKKKVVVRFPSSTDVRWYKAPKFKKGQKGVWLLHSDAPAAGAAARATGPSPGGAFTCLDPEDFQQAGAVAKVQALLPPVSAKPVARKKARARKTTKKTASRKRRS